MAPYSHGFSSVGAAVGLALGNADGLAEGRGVVGLADGCAVVGDAVDGLADGAGGGEISDEISGVFLRVFYDEISGAICGGGDVPLSPARRARRVCFRRNCFHRHYS